MGHNRCLRYTRFEVGAHHEIPLFNRLVEKLSLIVALGEDGIEIVTMVLASTIVRSRVALPPLSTIVTSLSLLLV